MGLPSSGKIVYCKSKREALPEYSKLRERNPDLPAHGDVSLPRINAYLTLDSYKVEFTAEHLYKLSSLLTTGLSLPQKRLRVEITSTSALNTTKKLVEAYIAQHISNSHPREPLTPLQNDRTRKASSPAGSPTSRPARKKPLSASVVIDTRKTTGRPGRPRSSVMCFRLDDRVLVRYPQLNDSLISIRYEKSEWQGFFVGAESPEVYRVYMPDCRLIFRVRNTWCDSLVTTSGSARGGPETEYGVSLFEPRLSRAQKTIGQGQGFKKEIADRRIEEDRTLFSSSQSRKSWRSIVMERFGENSHQLKQLENEPPH
ncbi:hypothetical protein K445DRAFT_370756 [Daldinia sp. EC12]|nr:hypothetical protein K445DRAFT_370756 [Daldinia sp. EC12]